LKRGAGSEAIALVQSTVSAYPKDAAPENLLGELYVATNDIPHAVDAFTQATALAPTWWPPYRNLALAKLMGKDPAGAIAAYEGGVKVAPTVPQLVMELAQLYERQGRVDDAIAQYEALYKRSP